MTRLSQILLSAFFWGYMCLSLVVFWLFVAPIWLLLLPFDERRRFSHAYATTWANHFVALSPFWRVRVTGRDNIQPNEAYVLVPNHQSAADIIVLYSLRRHFKWVSKDSVFRIPFLGWMMSMADYIPIRRGDRTSRQRMMDNCAHQLKRGSSVMIFAEGTRSRDGGLGAFRPGAFVLAIDTRRKVVPVVVEGTFDALPHRSWIFRRVRPSTFDVVVLEPIDPADFDNDATALAQAARTRIAAAQAQLRAAAMTTSAPTGLRAPSEPPLHP